MTRRVTFVISGGAQVYGMAWGRPSIRLCVRFAEKKYNIAINDNANECTIWNKAYTLL